MPMPLNVGLHFNQRPKAFKLPSVFKTVARQTFASRSGPDPWDSSASGTRATWFLISINALVFGAWQYATANKDQKMLQKLNDHATLSRENWSAGRYWTLVTSAFSHTDLRHFAFNMFALHAFGSIMSLVPGVGAVHILGAAIGSAVAGSTAWLYHTNDSRAGRSDTRGVLQDWGLVQVRQRVSALGASGMTMGLGAAATLLMPFAPMALFFIPIAIPLWSITAAYVVYDMYYLDSRSKIGHSAHLGGLAYGVAFYSIYLRNRGGVWQMARRVLRR